MIMSTLDSGNAKKTLKKKHRNPPTQGGTIIYIVVRAEGD